MLSVTVSLNFELKRCEQSARTNKPFVSFYVAKVCVLAISCLKHHFTLFREKE